MAKLNKSTTQKKGAGKPRNVRTADTGKAVMGVGPTQTQQQELIIPVKNGAAEFTLHPSNIPWLANVAPSHQEWSLAGLRIWYEPRVGTTTAGTVAVALVQDFSDTTPQSLNSITRLSGSKRGAPWTPFVLSSPKNRWIPYISKLGFDLLTPVEKQLRALGKIVVFADVDLPADTVVGNIYISYIPGSSLRAPTDPSTQQ